MRLVTVRSDHEEWAGAIARFQDVDHVVRLPAGVTILDVLDDPAAREHVQSTLDSADASAPRLDSLHLAAPLRPGKLLCLGYNYRGHAPDGADAAADDPEWPDVFVKTPNTIAGADDIVEIPHGADDVDYEGELAIVIGRRAHRVPEQQALDYVGGYTILDDVSDRAWQRRQSQWALGKCSDGFAPLGPWIVTKDSAPDPQNVLVEVIRDGQITVSQSTSTTIFSAAYVIHHLSQILTLEPGDVISTGTPQKLSAAQDTHRPLRDGDAVTIRISGIGELTTRFAAAQEATS